MYLSLLDFKTCSYRINALIFEHNFADNKFLHNYYTPDVLHRKDTILHRNLGQFFVEKIPIIFSNKGDLKNKEILTNIGSESYFSTFA